MARDASGHDRKLTPKQRLLIKKRIENPDASLRELALKTGYDSQPSVSRALNSPIVKKTLLERMDARPKLTQDSLLGKLEEGLEATKPNPCGPDEIPDHTNRRGYLQMAWELRGDLDRNQDAGINPNTVINIRQAVVLARQEGLLK